MDDIHLSIVFFFFHSAPHTHTQPFMDGVTQRLRFIT